jgi:pSer/pThr/pTyr-binding forkhead associated (FHA) protein
MRGVSASHPDQARGPSPEEALRDAERSGCPFLRFRDRDDQPGLFVFAPDSSSASVGRDPASDLMIDWDAQVSRRHARFEREREGGWVIVDDRQSSNGTFVNEERVSGRRRLSDGDRLRFGATAVLLRMPGPARIQHDDKLAKSGVVKLSSTQRRILVALCGPYAGPTSAPATEQQIAEQLVLSVGEVRSHLSVLYAKLGIDPGPQSEPRSRLAQVAFATGLISERDV